MLVYFSGLLLGLSLIMALGPQNIFLIRQGALRQHALLSALTCFFSDIILILVSFAGLQQLLQLHPGLKFWMACFGSLFLLYYGSKTLKQSFSKSQKALDTEKEIISRWQIIIMALGFSLLNPHAIIDTLVLIGGGSSQFPGQEHTFLFGVLSSSLIWFAVLTFTAYYFAEILTRVKVWRRVEFCSGMLMLYLSFKLIYGQF